LFATGTRNQSVIGRQRIERSEELETLDQCANERVHWDHSLGFQFTERHVDRPLILAGCVKAIEGEIGSFADAHAGVAKQQEHVAAEVVSSQ
jgi:hypothetical protein